LDIVNPVFSAIKGINAARYALLLNYGREDLFNPVVDIVDSALSHLIAGFDNMVNIVGHLVSASEGLIFSGNFGSGQDSDN